MRGDEEVNHEGTKSTKEGKKREILFFFSFALFAPSWFTFSGGSMAREAVTMRAIDVDVHPEITAWREIAEYVPAGLRHRVARQGGPPMARHGFKMVGDPYGDAPRPDGGVHPAADPRWVKEQYLDARGVDLAILTTNLTSLSVQPNADMAATLAQAINDWLLETWVRSFDCFKGSILVAPQDPVQAVAEIDRLAHDPGMVQVLMGSATESPLGRRQYHPIYEACTRHNLPLALHLGGEGAGMSPPSTAVGHPSTYFEWYAAIPQNYMAHITSMVTEGVFEKFPTCGSCSTRAVSSGCRTSCGGSIRTGRRSAPRRRG